MSIVEASDLTETEKYYLNGFHNHCFKESQSSKIINILKSIKNNSLKPGFRLEEKYRASLDLRPDVISYDDEFLQFILETGLYQKLRELTGQNLWLYHIQLRIAYPESNVGNLSYMDWHRDTYYKSGSKLGFFPPAHKIIFYPELSRKKRDGLKVIPGSQKAEVHVDQTYQGGPLNNFDKSLIQGIKEYKAQESNISALIFNTAILHGACQVEEEPQVRLIYSFVNKDQCMRKEDQHKQAGLYFQEFLERKGVDLG